MQDIDRAGSVDHSLQLLWPELFAFGCCISGCGFPAKIMFHVIEYKLVGSQKTVFLDFSVAWQSSICKYIFVYLMLLST